MGIFKIGTDLLRAINRINTTGIIREKKYTAQKSDVKDIMKKSRTNRR